MSRERARRRAAGTRRPGRARRERGLWPVAPTGRGVGQLAVGAALVAAGAWGGWLTPVAMGAATLLAGAMGLAAVLLARAAGIAEEAGPVGEKDAGRGAGRRRPAAAAARALLGLLAPVEAREGAWVRVDQRGQVIARLSELPTGERGLFRQRSVTLTWRDPFGFWRARRTLPADREVCVPPAVSGELARTVAALPAVRSVAGGRDAASVRAYERGDGLRQIAWRQSAHHGELMSFDAPEAQVPPVLVVTDALSAADAAGADALAATAAALLSQLPASSHALASDGTASWHTPVQQERLLAALAPERAGRAEAEARAAHVARLASAGGIRRRVLLVTCDERAGMGPALLEGPLARQVTLVRARGAGTAAPAREGAAEKDAATDADAASPRRRQARAGAAPELLACLCCAALALAGLLPLWDTIHAGPWVFAVAALLGAGAVAGSAAGSWLRARRARTAARVAVAVALAAALVAAGVLLVAAGFAERRGFGLMEATAQLHQTWGSSEADPAGAFFALVQSGVAQLAGTASWTDATAAWDLVITLAGAGLAAVVALLAGARATRAAVALVAAGLAVADQAVMGTVWPLWTAAVAAGALVLAWLAEPGARRGRAARGAVALLLAAALAGAGLAVGEALPTSAGGTGGPTAGGAGVGTGVNSLVDLSRDLQRRSNDAALTYTTTADEPLYLRIGVLTDFDGSRWAYEGTDAAAALLDEGTPLATAEDALAEVPLIATTIEAVAAGAEAVPPGTSSLAQGDGHLVARGRYLEPVRTTDDLDVLLGVYEALDAAGAGGVATTAPTAQECSFPEELPDAVLDLMGQARRAGADATDGSFAEELNAVRWLVAHFTSGDYTYALLAPGGDGEDNLAVIGDFLEEKAGYCTHYATAFALLARVLGVPSRVALGYAPSSATNEAGAYVVTMSELHAWCEVWLDGIGWVGVDVTPAAADEPGLVATATVDAPEEAPAADASEPPAADSTAATDAEPEPADAGANNPGDPAADAAGEQDAPAPSEPDAADAFPDWLAPVLLGCAGVAAVAGLAAGAVVLSRRRHRARLADGDWELAWSDICRAARRAGLRWDASATEDEVATVIAAALADPALADATRTIARNACLARYGTAAPAGDATAATAVARALRHRKP